MLNDHQNHNGVDHKHVSSQESNSNLTKSTTNSMKTTTMECEQLKQRPIEKNSHPPGSEILDEAEYFSSKNSTSSSKPYKVQIVWRNVIMMTMLHISALYGVYLYWFHAKYQTLLYQNTSVFLLGLGITCGAHRLWAHRSYEASLFLRIILMLLNSASLQNDIYEWCRDHRVHHKFSETDADPHNSKRGFFFAHCGWLMCRKHPDVMEKGRTVSMVDLEQDPVVKFQRKFYKPLAVLLTFFVPTWIAYYCWNEDYYTAYFLTMARYTFSLHATWLVNSAAHLYGKRPYDTSINPVESPIVEILSLGEGYHNYHHVFPYDYSASEMSWTHNLNFTTWVIDCCAWLGLAWNLKKVDKQTVLQRVKRTGDLEMVEIHHEQQYYSWWRHTIVPVLFFIIGPVVGIYSFRRSISWIYFQMTGVANKWP